MDASIAKAIEDFPILIDVLEFAVAKLKEHGRTGNSGLIGVDIPITNGEPIGGINTRHTENRKVRKPRNRFG